jgi:Holliday junction resolvase RusA-like endonuclease
MNPIIKFTIKENPVTKKNSQQIFFNKKTHRSFITQSERYKNYEAIACNYIPRVDTPIDYPVRVKATYYRKTKHLVDLNNLNQALHDIMKKYGLLKDDNYTIVASVDGTRCYIDHDNTRTEVEIYHFTK